MRSYFVNAWVFAFLSIAGVAIAPVIVSSQGLSVGAPVQQAQSGPSSGQESPRQLGSISGKVIDAESEMPVPGGWVLASRQGTSAERFGGRVQADGSYHIYRLEPGSYRIQVEAGGYSPGTYNPNPAAVSAAGAFRPVPITVTAGNETAGIDVKLHKEGVIAGRVVDENGQPVARAQVAAMQSALVGNQSRMVHRGSTATDARGEYRVAGLPPGEYVISAHHMAQVSMRNVVDRSDPHADRPIPTYEQMFYPGVADQSQATPIGIAAGEEKFGIDIHLSPVGGHKISGIVVMPDGSPATDCSLMLGEKGIQGHTSSDRCNSSIRIHGTGHPREWVCRTVPMRYTEGPPALHRPCSCLTRWWWRAKISRACGCNCVRARA